MITIVGNKGIGKTAKLIKSASLHNSVIVCKDTKAMMEKIHTLGYNGKIQVASYDEYILYLKDKTTNPINFSDTRAYVYIDNLSEFMRCLDGDINGYSDLIELDT